jgi:hypothetical protein
MSLPVRTRCAPNVGGGGLFEISDFVSDGGGTPRTAPSRLGLAPAPGMIEVTVENADVSDLKIVVAGSQ